MKSKITKKNDDNRGLVDQNSLREQAARQIVDRYTNQLKSLVRLHLNKRIRQKEGTSALVQSVFRSFFENDIDITNPKSFGTELLTTIALTKCKGVGRKYKRQKRDYRLEQSNILINNDDSKVSLIDLASLAAGPSPEDAARVIEMVQMLSDRESEVAILLFQGFKYQEIADKLGCVVRTIQRIVQAIRRKWKDCFDS